MKLDLRFSSFLVLALGLNGCREGQNADHPSDHDSKSPGAGEHATAHVHVAPHGGTLVELGEHRFNLELVVEAKSGSLAAYVLDAHAENFLRVPLASFQITLDLKGGTRPVLMSAVADSRTGETVGDTSRFEGKDEGMKDSAGFAGTVTEIEIGGSRFSGVKFRIPKDKL